MVDSLTQSIDNFGELVSSAKGVVMNIDYKNALDFYEMMNDNLEDRSRLSICSRNAARSFLEVAHNHGEYEGNKEGRELMLQLASSAKGVLSEADSDSPYSPVS